MPKHKKKKRFFYAVDWVFYSGEHIRRQLEVIENYIDESSSALKRSLKELEERVERFAKMLPDHRKDEAGEMYAEDAHDLTREFPALANGALFVAIYSFLEYEMTSLCGKLQREKKYGLKVGDLRDKGITASKVYLTKVCGIEFPSGSKEWQAIKNCQRVRNVIVHNRGRIEKDNSEHDKAREFLKREHSATIDDNDNVQITADFCLSFIETVKQFFVQLIDAIKAARTDEDE